MKLIQNQGLMSMQDRYVLTFSTARRALAFFMAIILAFLPLALRSASGISNPEAISDSHLSTNTWTLVLEKPVDPNSSLSMTLREAWELYCPNGQLSAVLNTEGTALTVTLNGCLSPSMTTDEELAQITIRDEASGQYPVASLRIAGGSVIVVLIDD